VPVYDNQGYREWGKCGGCDFVKKPCASADASGKFFCPSEATGSTRKCTNYRSPTQCKTDNFLATGCNLWRADGYYTARPGLSVHRGGQLCIRFQCGEPSLTRLFRRQPSPPSQYGANQKPSNPDLCSDTNLPTAKGFDGYSTARKAAGFRIASDSRCIDLVTSLSTSVTTAQSTSTTTITPGYACYPMRCTGGSLIVTVNSVDVACPFGTTVALAGSGGVTGSIKCACCAAAPAVPRPRASSRRGLLLLPAPSLPCALRGRLCFFPTSTRPP